MNTEQIVELVISILPSVIAVLTTIGVFVNVIRQFTSLKKEVVDMKSIDDVKVQLKSVVQENYELKKTLNETMTKIDHIQRN